MEGQAGLGGALARERGTLDSDPAAVEALGHLTSGAGAEKRIQHQVARARAGQDTERDKFGWESCVMGFAWETPYVAPIAFAADIIPKRRCRDCPM